MFDLKVTVKSNKKITPHLWILSFESSKLARKLIPGHFLEFKFNNSNDPYLRRPFSVYKIKGNTIEVLYEIVGTGTRLMSEMKKGDTLLSLGPLGNTFTPMKSKKTIFVGGGVGTAPLIFLSQRQKFHKGFFGFRDRPRVLPKKELTGKPSQWTYATNDGSVGFKGFVTQPLEKLFKQSKNCDDYFVYTCGPTPMLYEVARICQKYGVEGEISVEERMGCGVGACLGCVVKTRSQGYVPSCKLGPVFRINDLDM